MFNKEQLELIRCYCKQNLREIKEEIILLSASYLNSKDIEELVKEKRIVEEIINLIASGETECEIELLKQELEETNKRLKDVLYGNADLLAVVYNSPKPEAISSRDKRIDEIKEQNEKLKDKIKKWVGLGAGM